MRIADIRISLKSSGFLTKKSLGQNFLLDERLLERIVEAAQIGPRDNVLEIGPGPGALTLCLAKAARRVLALEIDRGLEILRAAL